MSEAQRAMVSITKCYECSYTFTECEWGDYPLWMHERLTNIKPPLEVLSNSGPQINRVKPTGFVQWA